ncbi:MAG: DEAD/DEAH box helicase [Vicinamibacterales bacterium]
MHALHAEPSCTALELDGIDADNASRRLTLLLPFERFAPLVGDRRFGCVSTRRWRHAFVDAVTAGRPYTSSRGWLDVTVDLHGYQVEPALALVRGRAARVLIADGVGLGKTIQAGLALKELAARGEASRVLVVVPAGLVWQWRDELARRVGLAATIVDWPQLRRMVSETPEGTNPWQLEGVFIVSMDFAKQAEVHAGLLGATWDVLVVDEAHAASPASQRRAFVDDVARRCRRVILLTATPHSGRDADFSALLGLGSLDDAAAGASSSDRMLVFHRLRTARRRRERVQCVRLSSAECRLHQLLRTYVRHVWTAARGPEGRGARLAMLVLEKRAKSSPWALVASLHRRLRLLLEAESGGSDRASTQPTLPFGRPSTAELVDDDAPDAWLGAPGLPNAGRETSWLRRLIAAGRLATVDDRKLSALRRLLVRAREPALVFTEYRDTLERAATWLARPGDVQAIHGGLSDDVRRRALDEFAAGRARVLLATDAASEGLNLQARCRLVVNIELPWSPNRLEQRAGRVDRLGQTRRVHVVHLVGRESGEDVLLDRLRARAQRIAASLAVTTAGPGGDARSRADAIRRWLAPVVWLRTVRSRHVPTRHPTERSPGGPTVPTRVVRRAQLLRLAWRAGGERASTRSMLDEGVYFLVQLPLVDGRGRAVERVSTVVRTHVDARVLTDDFEAGARGQDARSRRRRPRLAHVASAIWQAVAYDAESMARRRAEDRARQLEPILDDDSRVPAAREAAIVHRSTRTTPLQQPGLFEAMGWAPRTVPTEATALGSGTCHRHALTIGACELALALVVVP